MKKIGEIKGVPVVEGNINEVTKNQIHYKEDSGSIQLSKRGNDNKLNSVTGSVGSSESVKGFQYKSTKRFWKIPYDAFTDNSWEENNHTFRLILNYVPIYSAYNSRWSDAGTENYNMYYAYLSSYAILEYVSSSGNLWHQLYFEEAYVDKEILFEGAASVIPTLENLIKLFKDIGLDLSGFFVEITEEEYLNNSSRAVVGKELVN